MGLFSLSLIVILIVVLNIATSVSVDIPLASDTFVIGEEIQPLGRNYSNCKFIFIYLFLFCLI
jgi:hypothetical protein